MGGAQNPNFVKAVKTTKVFIGGIAPGVTDAILTGLIHTCGPLHKLNRVTGTTGKPQAFGFAEFEDPEVVLRCLKCLNGTELPDMTPKGRSERAVKALVVKADDKTRAFLDEFEELNIRTDHDDELDESARARIRTIVLAMQDPNADLNSIIPAAAAPQVSEAAKDNGPMVPDHLKDLDAAELPEDQRGEVLDQIASFRVQAQKKEEERKRKDEMLNARSENAGYGRGQQSGNQMRQWGNQRGPEYDGLSPMGDGPQGYRQPVGFVRGQTAQGKQESERTDEENERVRKERRKRDLADEYRNIENKVEQRESRLMRRLAQEAHELSKYAEFEAEERERERRKMREYDDDSVEDSGREVFFADRAQWRSMRQPIRRKEYQDDVRDRQAERDEMVELERQTEELLQKQMQDMAELEAKQRAAGYLFDDTGRIKVAIGSNNPAPVPAQPVTKQKATITFEGEDDEDAGKKKRTLIKLDDSDAIERNKQKLQAIRDGLPTDKTSLWNTKIKWDIIDESLLSKKIIPFIRKKLEESLGEPDEDLNEFVIQHVKERANPDTIVEGLEAVLDEDATKVVQGIWRLLAFETAAYVAGVLTGTMTL